MNSTEYVINAIRTKSGSFYMPYADSVVAAHPSNAKMTFDVLHAIVGIVTESAELLDSTDVVNMQEEKGDLLWYCAIYANARDETFDALTGCAAFPLFTLRSVVVNAAEMLDILKKAMFYGKPVDYAKLDARIGALLLYIAGSGDMAALMQQNIDKLRVRFPQVFTEEQANNRDLAAERMSLAGK